MKRCALAVIALALAVSAGAQMRRFPPQSLRGDLAFGAPPYLTINGQPVRMAPGVRIRNINNAIVTSGSVMNSQFTGNYTLDAGGQLLEAWMLKPEELMLPWPKSPDEAGTLVFDSETQTWSRK